MSFVGICFPFCGLLCDWFGFMCYGGNIGFCGFCFHFVGLCGVGSIFVSFVAFVSFFPFCMFLSFGRALHFVEVCGSFLLVKIVISCMFVYRYKCRVFSILGGKIFQIDVLWDLDMT